MHYFQFNIGDYASHTRNLSLMEDLAFRRLLDEYYLHEHPLNECITTLARSIGMIEYKTEIEYVLSTFFVLTESGWVNERAEREISAYQSKREQASRAGKASAAKRSLNGRSTDVEEISTDVQPNNNQEPINIKHKPDNDIGESKASTNGVPYQNIINLYHEILPDLPACKMLTTKRKGQIKQRWAKDMPDIENWKNFFNYVKQSPFLMGLVQPRDDRKPFQADLEWLTKESNFAKIYEGKYNG